MVRCRWLKNMRPLIIYDLSKSPFTEKCGDITYYFSSEYHRRLFVEKMQGNRKKINDSLSSRFGVRFFTRRLPDLLLYKKIETRGFRVNFDNQGVIEKWEQLKLGGERVIIRNYAEPSEISTSSADVK